MKIQAVILLMLLFCGGSALPQEDGVSVAGVVLDAKTLIPLSGATVALESQRIELICNDAGAFHFTVPRIALGDSMKVSHLGYQPWRARPMDVPGSGRILLRDDSIELRSVTVTSRVLDTREIDRSLRIVRGDLYAFEKETTIGMYNLFLSYLEEHKPELHKICQYDISAFERNEAPLFAEYFAPQKKPVNKRDTTSKDYSEFPAVNISHHAAKFYCEWLTDQYNSQPGKKQFSKVIFRLPTLKEWQVAALGYPKFQSWNLSENVVEVLIPSDSMQMTPRKGVRKTIPVGTDVLYPWFGSYYYRRSPQNHRGCFLGNFKVVSADRPCDISKPGIDGWTMMAQTSSYFPNDIGLFDVVGNVAEMIDESGRACGGSWNEPPEKSTLHSVKSYRRPDSTIGFRIFMEVVER